MNALLFEIYCNNIEGSGIFRSGNFFIGIGLAEFNAVAVGGAVGTKLVGAGASGVGNADADNGGAVHAVFLVGQIQIVCQQASAVAVDVADDFRAVFLCEIIFDGHFFQHKAYSSAGQIGVQNPSCGIKQVTKVQRHMGQDQNAPILGVCLFGKIQSLRKPLQLRGRHGSITGIQHNDPELMLHQFLGVKSF